MKRKVYTLTLTRKQMEHLGYVCDDVAEVYEDKALADERPYTDFGDPKFLMGVSETLLTIRGKIKEELKNGK